MDGNFTGVSLKLNNFNCRKKKSPNRPSFRGIKSSPNKLVKREERERETKCEKKKKKNNSGGGGWPWRWHVVIFAFETSFFSPGKWWPLSPSSTFWIVPVLPLLLLLLLNLAFSKLPSAHRTNLVTLSARLFLSFCQIRFLLVCLR